jgi:hypothetical protein
MKIFLSLIAIALIPALSSAQSPRADSIPQILEKVDSGAPLRVRTQRQTVRGTLTGVGTEALVLGVSSGVQTPIRYDAVEEMWRQGHYAKHGAVIGGTIGATVLSGFGLLLISALCETDDGCRSDKTKVVLFGVAVGGGAGALLGAGVGYLTKRWIEIY